MNVEIHATKNGYIVESSETGDVSKKRVVPYGDTHDSVARDLLKAVRETFADNDDDKEND